SSGRQTVCRRDIRRKAPCNPPAEEDVYFWVSDVSETRFRFEPRPSQDLTGAPVGGSCGHALISRHPPHAPFVLSFRDEIHPVEISYRRRCEKGILSIVKSAKPERVLEL